MLICTENSKAITDFLEKDLIINLNILGIIKNEPDAKIYVDNVENPEGILVNAGYFNYLYSQKEEFIKEVVQYFNHEGEFGFSGVENSIAEKIMPNFKVEWISPCRLYHLKDSKITSLKIKNEVKSVDVKDAEIIDFYYTYKGEGSLEAIKKDILKRPSSCIYKDDELACWLLTHEDNSLGIMYTKEEHRGSGYAVDVTLDMIAKHEELGNIPFLQIVNGNNMSPGLAKKCGFVESGDVTWFGIKVGSDRDKQH